MIPQPQTWHEELPSHQSAKHLVPWATRQGLSRVTRSVGNRAQAIARFSRNVGWSLSLPLLVWLPGQRRAGPGWAGLGGLAQHRAESFQAAQVLAGGEKQRNWSSSSGPAPSDKSLHEGWRQHPSCGGGTRVPSAALTWFGHQGWHLLPESPLGVPQASYMRQGKGLYDLDLGCPVCKSWHSVP